MKADVCHEGNEQSKDHFKEKRQIGDERTIHPSRAQLTVYRQYEVRLLRPRELVPGDGFAERRRPAISPLPAVKVLRGVIKVLCRMHHLSA